tara:strand:+ start:10741 stop:11037 length:297 start_codon:yes stop_codon:yes gene_type:complete
MSSGNKKVDLSGKTDEQLQKLVGNKKAQKASEMGRKSGLAPDLVGQAQSILKKRKEAKRKAHLKELDTQRDETIALLQERPGRNDGIMGSGSNNPFRL